MNYTFQAITAALALALVACTPQQAEPPTGDSTGEEDTGTATNDPTGGECVGPNGCFSCPPTKSEELLNACSDATCEPFANTKERLPKLDDDGTLPPLP